MTGSGGAKAAAGGRRTTTVACLLFAVGMLLAFDAWRAGSLWRYQLLGYCAAGLLAVPLATRLVFGRRVHRFWRRVAFVAVPLLLSLLVGEVLMRWFGPTPERPPEILADARLGHRLVPATGGTDARGWRNPEVRERTDVLFVGDSQTYGFAVEVEQAFSQQFAQHTGAVTYQMANGSYGPVQYRELVQRGLELQPKLVVLGFYFGNDLLDATHYAGLAGAEAVRSAGRKYVVRANPDVGGGPAPNLTMSTIDWVLRSSHLLDAGARAVKSRLLGGSLDAQPGAVPFAHATAATMFLPDYRWPAVDPDSEAVAEGLRCTERCLHDIATRCQAAGVRCLLLLIPTKESNYAAWQGNGLPELAKLQAAESGARAKMLAMAAAVGIAVVDVGDPLVAALEAGEMPWFASGDGHLNATGHRIVAEALQQHWPR